MLGVADCNAHHLADKARRDLLAHGGAHVFTDRFSDAVAHNLAHNLAHGDAHTFTDMFSDAVAHNCAHHTRPYPGTDPTTPDRQTDRQPDRRSDRQPHHLRPDVVADKKHHGRC